MPLVFLTGGVRSGKSSLAVRWAAEHNGSVHLIATAEALDDDMTARIERHRRDRPAAWTVVEEPKELARALNEVPDDACVVIDCLTLWVSNLMLDDRPPGAIEGGTAEAVEAATSRSGTTIVVTNEVGSGIHPATELGRRYAEVLGRVNMSWSRAADEAYLVVAGRPLRLG